MPFQFDSLSFSESKDKVTAHCMCGSIEHGQLTILSDPEDESFFLQFLACSYADNLKRRIKNLIDVFFNRPINTDLCISSKDAIRLAEWIIEESKKVPNKSRIDFKTYREIMHQHEVLKEAFKEMSLVAGVKLSDSDKVTDGTAVSFTPKPLTIHYSKEDKKPIVEAMQIIEKED